MTTVSNKKILDGVKVICFGMGGAAPLGTAILGDFGAEIIKIEPPTGDWSRTTPGLGTREFNRNKKGIAVDLKSPEGMSIVGKLLQTADVMMESFRPGVMTRLGLGYDQVKEINPRIVYCSVSAYGQTGPWREKPGVDGIIQAVAGMMSVLGHEGDDERGPIKVSFPIVDMTAGLLAAQGILLGLIARDKHGVGQHVDVSLLEAALVIQKSSLTRYLNSSKLPLKTGSRAPYSTPNQAYRTKDGYIMLAAYTPARWGALCRNVLNMPELEHDERFQHRTKRQDHHEELTRIIESVLMQKTTAEWIEICEANDLMCAPINTYEDVVSNEQVVARDAIQSIEFSDGRKMRTIAPAPKFSETPGEVVSPYPEVIGQHTRQILKAHGYTDQEIEDLQQKGVIQCAREEGE